MAFNPGQPWVHPMADVHPTANLGPGTKVWAFAVVGANVDTGSNCSIGAGAEVGSHSLLGEQTRIGHGAFLPPRSIIGARVFIGPNATFTDDKYPIVNNPLYKAQPPTVEDEASVGANATILPGVRLGAGCCVGAGAVVTRDVPSGRTVRGNPARVWP